MKNHPFTHMTIVVLIAIQFLSLKATFANSDSSNTSIFQALYAQKMPSIFIEADFSSLAIKGVEEVQAQLTIKGLEKENWQIKLATRGAFRRSICEFTPLTLNFKKGDLRDAGYLDYDDIKMVTHCNGPEEGLENVYKEYLAYELYNHITPNSFKAKMVSVTYVDSANLVDTINSWAVLLEPNKEMSERIGGEIFDKYNLPKDSLDADNYVTMAMFEFMIGNHDWSLEMHRNIKCVYKADMGKYIIVPYDFDFSGLVNPEYYKPPRDIPITHQKDRLYMGKYFDEKIPDVVALFMKNKDSINEHCKGFDTLPKKSRNEVSGYINDFYKVLKKDSEKITFNYRIEYQDF